MQVFACVVIILIGLGFLLAAPMLARRNEQAVSMHIVGPLLLIGMACWGLFLELR